MGTENRKIEDMSDNFFQKQIDLYRWRSNPSQNIYISRTSFTPKIIVASREKLRELLLQNKPVCISDIMDLKKDIKFSPRDEILSFERYSCNLTIMESELRLEEFLYVFECLLQGYQSIFLKMENCFVTENGEVRAWISPDYMTNEINLEKSSKKSIIMSEISAIKAILSSTETLLQNQVQFVQFYRNFRAFMQRDILKNWSFTNARKFINSFVYSHKITVASSLEKRMEKMMKRQNMNSSSQLSQLDLMTYRSSQKSRKSSKQFSQQESTDKQSFYQGYQIQPKRRQKRKIRNRSSNNQSISMDYFNQIKYSEICHQKSENTTFIPQYSRKTSKSEWMMKLNFTDDVSQKKTNSFYTQTKQSPTSQIYHQKNNKKSTTLEGCIMKSKKNSSFNSSKQNIYNPIEKKQQQPCSLKLYKCEGVGKKNLHKKSPTMNKYFNNYFKEQGNKMHSRNGSRSNIINEAKPFQFSQSPANISLRLNLFNFLNLIQKKSLL